jgi:hypothetical protein
MARHRRRGRDDKRERGAFLALPHLVLDSPNYRDLGHTARSLLIDIARQYNGNNNGRLVACAKYLRPLGWRSADVVNRAKKELIASDLLLETRMGWRPNRAAWYALTWFDLDIAAGLDINPERYRKGAYLRSPIPSDGPTTRTIAPSRGLDGPIAAPPHGSTERDSEIVLLRPADHI